MPWQRSRLAPYGSVRAFLRFLQAARQHGWPQRVDLGLLEAMGLRGGSAWEVLVALRFFGLVDPATDSPTERYALLLQQWPKVREGVREAIHNAYAGALGDEGWLGRPEGELERMLSARYGGALARRQARFALGVARALGLPVAEPPRRRLGGPGLEPGAVGGAGAAVGEGEMGGGVSARDRPDGGEIALRRRYVEVLLRRLERADPREAVRLERRIEALLAGRGERRGVLAALAALVRPFRRRRRR
ncbi:MAG TPA: hypothetical protein VNL95_06470 [Dehalococcoidia bacterium]|nr:hypothetical protein [Dehalococcoidia bacterium]